MLTPERTSQFEYLLLEILHFVKLNFSVRDAAICAFFYTAERYDKKEQTIRDMVTRCCCADTNFFMMLFMHSFQVMKPYLRINIILLFYPISIKE